MPKLLIYLIGLNIYPMQKEKHEHNSVFPKRLIWYTTVFISVFFFQFIFLMLD